LSGELVLGAFYAPKTQIDSQGQRILWGWIPEKRSEAEYSATGWAGMMSLPRVLHLDPDGTLRMMFLPTLRDLRSPATPQIPVNRIPKSCGEVLWTIPASLTYFELALHGATNNAKLLHVQRV